MIVSSQAREAISPQSTISFLDSAWCYECRATLAFFTSDRPSKEKRTSPYSLRIRKRSIVSLKFSLLWGIRVSKNLFPRVYSFEIDFVTRIEKIKFKQFKDENKVCKLLFHRVKIILREKDQLNSFHRYIFRVALKLIIQKRRKEKWRDREEEFGQVKSTSWIVSVDSKIHKQHEGPCLPATCSKIHF